MDDLWTQILSEIQIDVSKGTFLTFFKHTELVSFENNVATISVPTFIIADQLEKKYLPLIKSIFDKRAGASTSIIFTYTKAKNLIKKDEGPLFTIRQPELERVVNPRIKKEYQFSSLAVSDSNQLAYTASMTVAENPGKKYNPLFIYGDVGVGKTHLMHAIANTVLEKNPQAHILYLTTEEFTNEVVEAIMNKSTQNIRKKFRHTNLLLLDDIQFLAGKEKVQEELFHTFNALIDGGGQIVFSSDRPPSEIKKIEARLASRFEGGLTVDIQPPDFELRTAILMLKSRKRGNELDPELAKMIAERIENTRALEGFLLKLATVEIAKSGPITRSDVFRLLGEKQEKEKFLHPDTVVDAVCNFYNIKSTQLKGDRRDAIFVKPRQICMYLLKQDLRLSFKEIGNLLGGRDHTTVMHGVDKMAEGMTREDRLKEEVMHLRKLLAG